MKTKINLRLITIAVCAILSTVIGMTLVFYNLFQIQVKNDLAINAKLLKDTRYFESVDINSSQIDLSTTNVELRVTWINEEGKVLYDNDVTESKLTNHLNRPEIKEAFKTGIGQSVRKSDTLNKNTFYYAVLLDNGTVLRVATDAQSMYSVFMNAAPIIGFVLLLIIVICIALSQLLTKQLIKPIEQTAENLENADYQAPYKELEPFTNTLRAQHVDIIAAAKARQDFTANVSHELKTPLTAISGYAELLENDMYPMDKQKHVYQEIHKNADRLLLLINDIIRLSQLDRQDHISAFEEIDLDLLLQECKENILINAKKRNIEIEFNSSQTYVQGNKEMLKELIENLVQNAIKYNNINGKVWVKVGVENDQVIFRVKDNGIGIPISDQPHIFERFYRVDKSRSKQTGGTGLGLAIVKHIVELHDAKIKLESEVNVGTTITIYF